MSISSSSTIELLPLLSSRPLMSGLDVDYEGGAKMNDSEILSSRPLMSGLDVD